MDENETEELDEIDYFEGWDDDSEPEAAEEVEKEADEPETEEVQDQPTEGAEDEKAEEEPAKEPEQPRNWKLKHNGEEVDADEAKMVELAQKGLDYDRVRGERDTFKSEHPKYAEYEKFLQEMAESAGTDVPGLMESVRVSLLVKKAQAEGKTLSEAAAIQQVRREALAKTTPKADEPKPETKPTEEDKRRETIRAFVNSHPTVKADEIPRDVLQEGLASGDLSGAYDRWEIKQLKEKLGNFQKELEAAKQNQKNKERSTGSKRTSSSVATDPWFDGWPDD